VNRISTFFRRYGRKKVVQAAKTSLVAMLEGLRAATSEQIEALRRDLDEIRQKSTGNAAGAQSARNPALTWG